MPNRRKSLRIAIPAVLLLAIASGILATSESKTFPARNPVGEPFPDVVGRTLEEVRTELPAAYAGAPAVLLIGYEQEAQFDIDRWLMGLLQSGVEMRIVEIPTIPGLMPTIASRWIDDGMRSGIPREDWGSVVTLYGKAARPVAELTGTDRGRLARVIVLDGDGVVRWFDDGGYSARKALAVAEFVTELAGR